MSTTRHSDMPFTAGISVVERIGEGAVHHDRTVQITEASKDGAKVRTQTGLWYDQYGGRIPRSDSYRSIRSMDYLTTPAKAEEPT